jgi:hypothetical protein
VGEIADYVLNGALCAECGMIIDGKETGYFRHCEDCGESEE